MMQNHPRRRRRQLSPDEEQQPFYEVTSQQLPQADAARKSNVKVSRSGQPDAAAAALNP